MDVSFIDKVQARKYITMYKKFADWVRCECSLMIVLMVADSSILSNFYSCRTLLPNMYRSLIIILYYNECWKTLNQQSAPFAISHTPYISRALPKE